MTENQKRQVLQLRAAGVSFAEIADQTGLSISTIAEKKEKDQFCTYFVSK